MDRREARRLLGELEFYLDQLDRIGDVLVDFSCIGNRTLISQAADTYRHLTIDVVDIYSMLKQALRKRDVTMGDVGPKVSLEIRERAFIHLRDGYDLALKKLKKLEHHGHPRELKAARFTVETLHELAENSAKDLVAEAHRLGHWTVEWEREIGLRSWLR